MWRSLLAPRRLSPAAMPEGVSNSHLRRSYLRRQHDEVVTRHYSPLSNAASVNSPQYLSTTSLSADENQGRNSRGSLPRNTGSLRPASSLSDDNDRKETNGEDNDDESFSKLSAAIHSIQQRAMENDLRQSIENPKPWFSLLHYPSRAAWRSTDHMLGDARKHLTNNTEDRADNDDSDDSPLAETQFNLLKHSERTNKQLKRTYKRIVEIHSALQLKRERERRMAANYWTDHEKKWQKKQSVISEAEEAQNQHHDDDDASLMGDSTAFTTTASNSSSKKTPASASQSDDPSVFLALSAGLSKSTQQPKTELSEAEKQYAEIPFANSAKRANRFLKRNTPAPSSSGKKAANLEKPIGYGPEQTLTHTKYRLGPNYSIARRVLLEVKSLLGGNGGGSGSITSSSGNDGDGDKTSGGKPSSSLSFRPKRVLDFGSGVGSSSAAALDVFGVSRSNENIDDGRDPSTSSSPSSGIDWVHCIDASKSMRDASQRVLKSVLDGVPWGHHEKRRRKEAEELMMDEQDRIIEEALRSLRSDNNISESRKERRLKIQQKWEREWKKLPEATTRLTFGESIVDSSSFSGYDELREKISSRTALPWEKEQPFNHQYVKYPRTQHTQKGSFDLILCTYTLTELPSVASGLTAATLLWEKLAAGGVIVFVEPGNPDGFSMLRSVRSMLLECCPPKEIRKPRTDDNVLERNHGDIEPKEWHEECHVIAPCTHNGTCPMSRHQKNHVKKNSRFGKYEDSYAASNDMDANKSDKELTLEYQVEDKISEDDMLKELLENAEYLTDAELEEVMKAMEKMEEEQDAYEEDDDDNSEEFSYDSEDDVDGFTHISTTLNMKETNVFDSAFCSFVHNFPGGLKGKRGEKFSYLVLQKRTSVTDNSGLSHDQQDTINDIDLVELLAESIYHSQKQKDQRIRLNKQQKSGKSGTASEGIDQLFKTRSLEILELATKIEREFLDSNSDDLGLELLHHDRRRKGWGRLIRAPLKKKGHVLLDYCSGGCSHNCHGASADAERNAPKGRIIRQKVSRGWSARVAPGCYAAARKARWGGFWPDLAEKVKEIDSK
mmetsp:Transcript_18511/g.38491  ORF Transcript_18511/g.38491 Transcript_18511/m.38491 type:complete len:1064 (+) Transcript_18511:146-3337(+)